MTISGEVIKKKYAIGSKSEREAVVICIENKEFLLQRKGGNPFYDEELDKLVGKKIMGHGIITPVSVILDDWQEII